jgi:hypothetical protein
MSVKLPSKFELEFDVDLDVSGIPTSYSFAITNLPKINVGVDPMEFRIAPIEVRPLDMSFRLKEVPAVRVHFPVDYKVGFTLLGTELACVRLCGQGQVITEPYVPNRCECGKVQRPDPVPVPPPRDRPAPG